MTTKAKKKEAEVETAQIGPLSLLNDLTTYINRLEVKEEKEDISIPPEEPASEFPPKTVYIKDLEKSSKAKTITVIAKTATWVDKTSGLPKKYVMETGRLGAQIGHAVSKLKLSYANIYSAEVEKTVYWLITNPITSIVLEARDSKELTHILELLAERNVHHVYFYDTNPGIYGNFNEVLTAISIGPVFDWMVEGITDYLYLWNQPDNPVG